MNESAEKPLHEKDIHNILLWMPNWIGDVVLAIPALQSLRRKFPHSRISAAVKSPADELLSGHPAVDTVIPIPLYAKNSLFSSVRFARNLKKYQFDLGVVLPNSLRSALLLFLTGAKHRLGYNTDGREIFLTHPLPVTAQQKRSRNRVDYFFDIFSPLQLDTPEMEFAALTPLKTDRTAEECLEEMGIEGNEPLIAIHPGTSKPERSWHSERFGILCQKLTKERPVKIILLGTPAERPLLERIHQNCSPQTAYILPAMNLREIAVLLAKCHLFIGNDSGMMHVAALANTPVVGIFGPGSPQTSGPFMDPARQELVTKNFPCSPCRQRFFKECKPSPHNKPYCLEDISVKDVSEAVHRLLEKVKKNEFASG